MECFHRPEYLRTSEEILNALIDIDECDSSVAEEIDNAESLEMVLLPPADGADSDQDDARSDEEGNVSTFQDIGKGVLQQRMEVRCVSEGNKHDIDVERLAGSNREDCRKGEGSRKNKIKHARAKTSRMYTQKFLDPTITYSETSETVPSVIEKLKYNKAAPIDLFRKILDDEIIEHIVKESVKYAAQKGFIIQLSNEDVYKYIAILILSGYCRVSHRRMYWETRPDTNNALVQNAMSRNSFDCLHRFFHVNDNNTIDKHDRIYKVRPLITHFNSKFQKLILPLGKMFSLDEAMEPYFGHHSMKQFIRGKPIRYGFKLWCLCVSNGYLIRFEPYTGASEREQGKSLGTCVTERLCFDFLPSGSTVYIDNYFNSLPLLKSLREYDINCVGTIRNDRIEKAPLNEMKKDPRGEYQVLQDSENAVVLVRWRDNNVVTLATNKSTDDVFGLGKCLRWSRNQRKKISIQQPTLVREYNRGMGGVDLFDGLRALYRIRIRSKNGTGHLSDFASTGLLLTVGYCTEILIALLVFWNLQEELFLLF